MTQKRQRQPSGKRETPEDRLNALAKSSGGRDGFLAAASANAFDRPYAKVLGLPSTCLKDPYVEGLGRWYDKNYGSPSPGHLDGPKPAGDLTDRAIIAGVRQRAKVLSPSLSNLGQINIEHVKSPDGVRDATLIIPVSPVALTHGPLTNIKQAIVTDRLIPGVTARLPSEYQIVPWQLSIPRRSLLVLPPWHTSLKDAPYVDTAKGVRVNPSGASFSLLDVRRVLVGDDIPEGTERMDLIFNEKGVPLFVPRIKEATGGMDFGKAEKEYFMQLLALRRGLGRIIDEPVLYGFYDNIALEGRQQGFIVVKSMDQGVRGDTELNQMTNWYVSKLMQSHPEAKKALIDGTLANIDATRRKVVSGEFKRVIGDLASDEALETYLQILDQSSDTIRDIHSTNDHMRLGVLPYLSAQLYETGVDSVDFKPIVALADDELLSQWRHDIEQIHRGSGSLAKMLLENAIAHEQPHVGNVRYKVTGSSSREVVACDWHDTHDLTALTYPQAVGYLSYSVRTLLGSARTTQANKLIAMVNPQPGLMALAAMCNQSGVSESLIQEVTRQSLTLVKTKGSLPSAPELDLAVYDNPGMPVTERNHPLFKLVMELYPEEKHRDHIERFKA